jgi:Protein of unknown function (DUF1674)
MSTLRNGVISGKLSPVMTNSEESAQGEQPGAVLGPVSPPLRTLPPAPREVGGREGPEPTRFGDWELRGRCIDF